MKMTGTLRHRGPDEEGYFLDKCIGLGHRRLSVIDLQSGRQPLTNEDETVWVVFNGEIYNFVELRDELVRKGHTFKTKSDTEVIVHLYEEYGEDFVQWLRGMFGIALWDSRAMKLILARDRLGKKPVYYALVPGHGIVFGSEIKALLQDPDVPREMDVESLDSYLSLLYVPAPSTIFKGINKLPAGHILIFNNTSSSVRQYWDVPCTAPDERPHTELMDELDDIISEAVRIRLRSDVPLGAFLSGGVDSSCVVAYMSDVLERPVVTCAVGFDESAHNELAYARKVAQHCHSEHMEHMVRSDIQDLIPRLAWLFDEPFADSSAVPTYYVSQMARQHVTVALSGDGGDELFAGYSRHALQALEGKLRLVLGEAGSRSIGKIAAWLPPVKGRNTLKKLGLPPDSSYALKHTGFLFNAEDKAQLYEAGLAELVSQCDPSAPFRKLYDSCEASDPLTKALYVDIKTYLADDILVKVDRMSMAHALEVRAPLLDHKLVEFVMRLPRALKLNCRTNKVALKWLLNRRSLGDIGARKKHGFTMPLAEWLRGPLREMMRDILLSPRFLQRGYFRPEYVRGLCDAHISGVHDYSHHLWMLMMFELWHRQYLDLRASA